MTLLLTVLSLFPFAFAAAMGLWSFVLLARGFRTSNLDLALAAVATAFLSCLFGTVGVAVVQQVAP